MFPVSTTTTNSSSSSSSSTVPHHDYLFFSFPPANSTAAMALQGSTFRQVELPGLQTAAASLLVVGVPGGRVLQVTAEGVRLLDASEDQQQQQQWRPELDWHVSSKWPSSSLS